ncbi:DUF1947 domain-containing protein [Candidatus Woesearchaeota archaeon]|nr:DUF1947 domain-containing protein [Candidatus Woesearchaeota archaeon]
MKQKTLRKSDIKALQKECEELYGNSIIEKNQKVNILEDQNNKYITVDDELRFFYVDNQPVPVLKFLIKNRVLKSVTVDMGAVKFVTNGADIMRPGITKVDDDIKENELVIVVDEKNNMPLAICRSSMDTEALRSATSGKVLKNIHYVGDDIWNF